MLLSPSDFFVALRKGLKPKLPEGLRGFRTTRGRGRLMKVYFDEPAFHYEAWHHTGVGKLEVGLHFESSAELNEAAFDFFRSRMVEVKASLPRAELEPWDRGWSRIYETLAAPRLDEEVLWRSVDCLAGYVISLQPLVDQFWKESR
ncbi:MAG TPA: hypothetical protein VGX27_00860 [Candidatus Dormibacteraeota bacterium]|nr:hypothetical protein [Candidatus Dormibacteraeota bacterium]